MPERLFSLAEITLTQGHLSQPKSETWQVFAWDEDANDYDTDESDGRSYISVVSEVITDTSQECEGRAKKTMGEARMDIVNSEIGYLGYYASEAYGLTWKVNMPACTTRIFILEPLVSITHV